MKNKSKLLICVGLVLIAVGTVLVDTMITRANMKMEFESLDYKVPKDFRYKEEYNWIEYSNKKVDASCYFTIHHISNNDIVLDSNGNITDTSLINNFGPECLLPEKINDNTWYTCKITNQDDYQYYMLYYDPNNKTSDNYLVEFSVGFDNSKDKVCENGINELKNSLSIKIGE